MATHRRRPLERGGKPDIDRALQPYVERVGTTPRKQLEWAIRLAERSPREMTPGDWDNSRREIAAFCALGGFRWVPPSGQDIATPDEGEAREIQKRLGELIVKVIRREPGVSFGVARIESGITWSEPRSRYVTWRIGAGWVQQAVTTLGRLLADHGHLVKECPAPAARGEKSETCETWFVASRPRQAFCSARCQSRATTRAYRRSAKAAARARGSRGADNFSTADRARKG